jgi:hypothetical protein
MPLAAPEFSCGSLSCPDINLKGTSNMNDINDIGDEPWSYDGIEWV